jgi:hypothetical protein
VNEQTTVGALYSKLLRLYPRQFRERLGESMEQTFRDLYRERRDARQGLFGFVLWTFFETSGGIIEEHVLQIRQGDGMQAFLTTLKVPAFISFLIVLPLMIMEVINRRSFNEGFPILLFVVMWLLPMVFLLILTPILRTIRAGNSLLASPVRLLFSAVFLMLIAFVWTHALIDQMPCFLGVPNCD